MTAKDAGELSHASALQGRRFVSGAGPEWTAAMHEAFDYRGDVTLGLDDGSSLTGYLFAHEPDATEPHVKLFPASVDAERVIVPLARIVAIEFSGDDKATGRSWEAWVRRYEEKKRLLEQGVDVGDIEPRSIL